MSSRTKKPARRKAKPASPEQGLRDEIHRLKGIIAVQHEVIRALRNCNAALDADRLMHRGAEITMTFER
jgi:hypothetical protein